MTEELAMSCTATPCAGCLRKIAIQADVMSMTLSLLDSGEHGPRLLCGDCYDYEITRGVTRLPPRTFQRGEA